jgi:hypothetical protein
VLYTAAVYTMQDIYVRRMRCPPPRTAARVRYSPEYTDDPDRRIYVQLYWYVRILYTGIHTLASTYDTSTRSACNRARAGGGRGP